MSKNKHIRVGRDYRKNRNTDGLRRSKPSGYRFRGEGNFDKPTKKEIQEHLDHKRDDIYFENRVERSDKKPFSKRGNRFDRGGKVGGRGFFGLTKGKNIEDVNELNIGDVILGHSKQFNADNTYKIVDKRQHGTVVRFDIVYWNPIENERIGNEDMSIGDLDFSSVFQNEYYFPKDKKHESGGELSHEQIVMSRLNENNEISCDELESIINRSPCYPVCSVGDMKLRKQFLKGCYKKI